MTLRSVIVDDNPAVLRAASHLLATQGVAVVGVAENGDQALALIQELAPDVVLVDYRMPGLNGAQTTTEVLRASPSSRVVCLTASISRDEMSSLLEAGAVACLTKDEDLEQIVASIHSAATAAA